MIASLLLSSLLTAPPSDCPQGAEFVWVAPDIAGACAVTAQATGFLVCAPQTMLSADQTQLRALTNDGVASAVSCDALEAIDAAVATNGAIAVADSAGVVRVRDASGVEHVIGQGALEEPSGVCWCVCNGKTCVAVSDRRLRAVLVFALDGTQVQRVGDGIVSDPRGLAAAADGSLYVADRLADCLWHFAVATDGSLDAKPRKIGEIGANPGQFSAPCDVAIRERAGQRCLFVAEELNHRVQILDGAGAFVGFFGMHALVPRLGNGRIHYPKSVALSNDGEFIAVAEAFEDRVQLFKLSAAPTPSEGGSGMDLISSHFGPEVACDVDLLAVLDVETEAVAVLDARVTPPIHMSIIGGGGASPNRLTEVSAISIEPAGSASETPNPRVWIADRGASRIDVFEIAWDRAREPIVDMFMPKLVRSMDLAAAAQRFTVPRDRYGMRTCEVTDIAFAPHDPTRVMLLDRANLAVIFTDARLAKGTVELLPTSARDATELAVAADGRIAVTDPIARRVYVRSLDGNWQTLSALGTQSFMRPVGVAFDERGALVVSDAALDACIVADLDGTAHLIGEHGVLDEQFWEPHAIIAAPGGLLVIDRGNHRYQRFGQGFTWNLTGSLGRYYDRKRRGSPGAPPVNPQPSAATPPPAAKGVAP